MPELATNAVHPPRALVERYQFGIPIALLTSQLATGNCTKEKVGNLELGIKGFELNLVKRKELS